MSDSIVDSCCVINLYAADNSLPCSLPGTAVSMFREGAGGESCIFARWTQRMQANWYSGRLNCPGIGPD